MRWTNLLPAAFAVLLATSSRASAQPNGHVVHEARSSAPSRWAKRDRVPPTAKLPMRIGLAQSNLHQAHEHLMAVADPNSPTYGKHWTAEQVIDAFRPSNDTVDTVTQWLIDGGIPAQSIVHSDNKAWLAFHAPAHLVESLLYADYYEYQDSKAGGILPACERYHVPANIQEHIDYIHPGINLLAPTGTVVRDGLQKRDARSREAEEAVASNLLHDNELPAEKHLQNCDKRTTPQCIAALYDIPHSYMAHPNNSMGIFESELQFWNQEELNVFFSRFQPRIPNGTHPKDHNIDGGRARTYSISRIGPESLDLELAFPIVYPQGITVFNVDDLHYQSWANDTYTWGFNTLLDAIDGSYCTFSAYGETGDLPGVDPTYPDPGPGGYNGTLQCGVFKPTNVISFSYGGWEADVPIAYQRRQCLEFLKLGLQGTTFLFGSGDTGIGDYPAAVGGFNGPTGCLGPNHNIHNPSWPSTCPYITSVGATALFPGQNVSTPESAAFLTISNPNPYHLNFTSGGGFSNLYPAPDYQQKALRAFFTNHNPKLPHYTKLATDHPSDPYTLPNVSALAAGTDGLYNRAGRGYPDVSCNGQNIAAIFGTQFIKPSGTSGSTPLFAAVINRVNEERLARGKKSVGFINPVLYTHPEVLNDVVNGSNPGCYEAGFEAGKGWDPVTGLGTPHFSRMVELWLSLP